MNFEKNYISEKRFVTPERLLDACQKLADVLANSEWADLENRGVEITRSFREAFGREVKVSSLNQSFQEHVVSTTVNFKAEKEVNEYDEGSLIAEEIYSISAAIGETIHHSELPDYILEQISEGVLENDDEDEEGGAIAQVIEPTKEFLAAFIFEREQEIGYVINEEGDIEDYYVGMTYLADGEEIDTKKYSWSDQALSESYMPTSVIDNKVIEWQKDDESVFDSNDIARFLETFEAIIEKLTDLDAVDAIYERSYDADDTHYRRALGIVAMTASGFKGIKIS